MTWRPASREERQLAWLWAFAAGASLLLRPLWLLLPAYLPPCALRTLTGVPCPTCGTTHAAVALLEGRLAEALHANPLAALAGAAFLVGGVVAPLWIALRLPVPVVPMPLPGWVRVTALVAIVAGWIWVMIVWA